MLKGYVIKRNVYQGADGVQSESLSQVKTFDCKDEAEAVAANCGGRVVNVRRPLERQRKPTRGNQLWMKQ